MVEGLIRMSEIDINSILNLIIGSLTGILSTYLATKWIRKPRISISERVKDSGIYLLFNNGFNHIHLQEIGLAFYKNKFCFKKNSLEKKYYCLNTGSNHIFYQLKEELKIEYLDIGSIRIENGNFIKIQFDYPKESIDEKYNYFKIYYIIRKKIKYSKLPMVFIRLSDDPNKTKK